ncbi:MAG: undecaprenyl-phosphate glucose phosphotransferase [Planctomycetes bacterium]|nr:undecaprenyl-phosphate glucose phosphotransferase [Planctomycetota bacterium]
MLRKYNLALVIAVWLVDLAVTGAAFLLAYWVRFHFPAPKGVPPVEAYLGALPLVLVMATFCYRGGQLYAARRMGSMLNEAFRILKASTLCVVCTVAALFFYRVQSYSQAAMLIFAALNPLLLIVARWTIRSTLRVLRRRGYNLRYALVVGTGRVAQRVALSIQNHPWTGIAIRGLIDERGNRRGRVLQGIPVVGGLDELDAILRGFPADLVFVAIPRAREPVRGRVLEALLDRPVEVIFVPDFHHLMGIGRRLSDFDGLPLLHLSEGPQHGWNHLAKRAIDVGAATAGLVLAAPLMAAIAVAIRCTSRGPVLYRQRRVGFDQREFEMVKFRTMVHGAEDSTGAVWAVPGDGRTTAVGQFLRTTSLDELPQLWNVLKGEMSLVGPRPERPCFVDRFRREFPEYSLRHRVKAGMTGWAQIHGWRGNTSLRKRLQYDLYYIENWSLALDVRILLLTMLRGFTSRNAY